MDPPVGVPLTNRTHQQAGEGFIVDESEEDGDADEDSERTRKRKRKRRRAEREVHLDEDDLDLIGENPDYTPVAQVGFRATLCRDCYRLTYRSPS
jgi:SPT6-like protein